MSFDKTVDHMAKKPVRNTALFALCMIGLVSAVALSLTGCSGGQVGYIATDGDLRVGTGDYDTGQYVEMACDFNSGSVRISNQRYQQGIPVTINTKAASCDTQHKKLIVPIRSGK